ncbi:MAG: metallophosphoesterase [Bacteroidota bacterium]
MNRRLFIQNTVVAGAALALAPQWAMGAKETRLTVLHTNDMHSRIDPFPAEGGKFAGLGGMARRAAMISKIRQEHGNVLLLDAGDVFQGTPYFNYYGGEPEFKLMSRMGYDAATLGNHDFDNGLEGLKRMLPHAKFPFINANYDFSGTILSGQFAPYKIFDKGGIKVGVYGLGIELKGLVADKNFGNTKYLDPVTKAKETAALLRSKGCHLVICLSHLGLFYDTDRISDRRLAPQATGTDLIIGGHTHTLLEKPENYTTTDGSPIMVNQVGWAGICLGRIDYVFSSGKNLKQVSAAAMPVGGSPADLQAHWEG